jgi:hypothetical protein
VGAAGTSAAGDDEAGALSEADAGRLQCLLRAGHLHSVLQQVRPCTHLVVATNLVSVR